MEKRLSVGAWLGIWLLPLCVVLNEPKSSDPLTAVFTYTVCFGLIGWFCLLKVDRGALGCFVPAVAWAVSSCAPLLPVSPPTVMLMLQLVVVAGLILSAGGVGPAALLINLAGYAIVVAEVARRASAAWPLAAGWYAVGAMVVVLAAFGIGWLKSRTWLRGILASQPNLAYVMLLGLMLVVLALGYMLRIHAQNTVH